MARAYNVEVNIEETRGDVGKLIRKFTKKVKKEKILEEHKEKMFFEKPSKKRRMAKIRKLQNARKAEAERTRKLQIK